MNKISSRINLIFQKLKFDDIINSTVKENWDIDELDNKIKELKTIKDNLLKERSNLKRIIDQSCVQTSKIEENNLDEYDACTNQNVEFHCNKLDNSKETDLCRNGSDSNQIDHKGNTQCTTDNHREISHKKSENLAPNSLKIGTKHNRLFLRIFLDRDIDIDNNEAVNKAIIDYELFKLMRTTTYDKKSVKKKVKIEVNSVEKWYGLLNNGIYVENKHYLVQPWVFKPRQCNNCASFDHKEENCKKIKRCLHCAKDNHKVEDCKAAKYECLNCGIDHFSYSLKCTVVNREDILANSFYIRLLKERNIMDKYVRLYEHEININEDNKSVINDQISRINITNDEDSNSLQNQLKWNLSILERLVKIERRDESIESRIAELYSSFSEIRSDIIRSEDNILLAISNISA